MAKPGKHAQPTVPRRSGPGRAPLFFAFCLCAVVGAILILLALGSKLSPALHPHWFSSSLPLDPGRLLEEERSVFARYGGSASCRDCHQEQFVLWKGSHH